MKLGYIETSCLSASEMEQLKEDLKDVAVCKITEDHRFCAFGDIDEVLDPEYDFCELESNTDFLQLRALYLKNNK